MPFLDESTNGDEVVRKRSKRMYLFDDDLSGVGCSKNHSSFRAEQLAGEKKVEGNKVATIFHNSVNASDTAGKVSDEERNKYVSRIMEFSLLKAKQLASRAFQEDLIGKLAGVVERETLIVSCKLNSQSFFSVMFNQAGRLLDASARIYSFRVDVTHTTVYEVRSKLGDEDKSKDSLPLTGVDECFTEDGKKLFQGEIGSKESDECNPSTSNDDNAKVDKRRRCIEYAEEDLPSNYLLSNNPVDNDEDVDKFLGNYFCQRALVLKRSNLRRSKIGTLIHELSDLNSESSTFYNDQLYCKAIRNVDEGSCTGLLMQNALTCDNGRKILLHNRSSAYKNFNDDNATYKDIKASYGKLLNIVLLGYFQTLLKQRCPTPMFLINNNDSHHQSLLDTANYCRISGPSSVSVIREGQLFNYSIYMKLFNWRINFQDSFNVTTAEMINILRSILLKFKNIDWNTVLDLLFFAGRNRTKNVDSEIRNDCSKECLEMMALIRITHKDCGKLYKPNEIFFGKTQEWTTEKSLKQLWQILEKVVNKEKIFFKSIDLQDVNEGVITPAPSSAIDCNSSNVDGAVTLLETIAEEANCVDAVVDKTVVGSNILEISEKAGDIDYGNVSNDEVSPTPSVPFFEKDFDNFTLEKVFEAPVHENNCTEPSNTVVSSEISDIGSGSATEQLTNFCNDYSHWSGNCEKSINDKDNNLRKAVLERKRRKKSVHKEISKGHFIFDDTDDFPLDVLKSKLKRTQNSKMKEENVLCIRNGRNNFKFTPDVFKQFSFTEEESKILMEGSVLSKVLVKDWCHQQSKRVTSEKGDDSVNSRQSRFLSLFNGMFDKTSDDELHDSNCSALYKDASMPNDETNDDGLNTTATQSCEQSKIISSQGLFETSKMRQRRINAQAVKRAIGSVLSSKNLDVIALKHDVSLLEASEGDRIVRRMSQLSNDLSFNACNRSFSNLSASEVELQIVEEKEIVEDPTQDVHNVETLVEKIHVQGTHTFSSVLAHVPDFLVGRTAEDVNPVDIFCIFLHLCNENNLEVVQRHDDHGLILTTELEDFTIINSRSGGISQKRKIN
uniref:Condensin complex subunit 2 n=1 Tax=Syphacia muris TaxID=451379 RepID=A0A0N5AL35_9BILA